MPVVHAVAEAVFEGFAVLALPFAGPVAVAEGLESGVPDFPEVVGVDVALAEMLAVDVGAGADGAIDENRGDVDACMAEVGSLTHCALVGAEVSFAAEGNVESFLSLEFLIGFALLGDEVHKLDELGIGEVEFGVVEGAADGDDGEDAPLLYAQVGEFVVDFLQVGQVALVDTGDDIEVEPGLQFIQSIKDVIKNNGIDTQDAETLLLVIAKMDDKQILNLSKYAEEVDFVFPDV